MPNDILRRAGSLVNQYLGDVSTATAPGMTGDLMSFLRDELTKYPGTSERDANAPTFDVINNVITNLLEKSGLNNPIENIEGPANAMLGPIGRVTAEAVGSAGAAKGVNQAQKKIIKALFRGDPETLKEVVNSGRMMHVGVPGAGGTEGLGKQNAAQLVDAIMGKDTLAHFQPGSLGGTVRVHPKVMQGISPTRGTVLKSEGVEGLPDLVTHEATHFLNDPGFVPMATTGPTRSQFDLAAALRPFLAHTKYGPNIVAKHLSKSNTPSAVNEALSYLSQPTAREPAATWLHNTLTSRPREGGVGQFDDYTQELIQNVLQAALEVPGAKR